MTISPISKINHDCLLLVFQIATEQIPTSHDEQLRDRRLDAIRAASQVCRRWRGLLMNSPMVWGKVIHLGSRPAYTLQRVEWIQELVRRAGSAPLWISGIVAKPKSYSHSDSQTVFIQLLQLQWQRLQRLSVVVHGKLIPETIQRQFLSAAPVLRTFRLELPDFGSTLFLDSLKPGSPQRLFADCAPFLQEIWVNKVAFRPASPWLSRIRKISLKRQHNWPSVQDIFIVLQHTPILEKVDITVAYFSCVGIYPPLPRLELSNLSSISLSADLGSSARILAYMTPGPLTVFRLSIHHIHSQGLVDDYVVPSFKKNLPSFIANYFTTNISTRLHFRLDRNRFSLYDTTNLPSVANDPPLEKSNFLIALCHTLAKPGDQDSIITCLLDTFIRASSLSGEVSISESVNEMVLNLSGLQSSAIISQLHSMLAIFDNIQCLGVNDASCWILLDLSLYAACRVDHPHIVLFPKLHTLRFIPRSGLCDQNAYEGVREFLLERNRNGYPVSRFDISTHFRRHYVNDLSRLEDVGGLEVIWKESRPDSEDEEAYELCSYVCGSGQPERLKCIVE